MTVEIPPPRGPLARLRAWWAEHVALVDLLLALGLWFFTALGT